MNKVEWVAQRTHELVHAGVAPDLAHVQSEQVAGYVEMIAALQGGILIDWQDLKVMIAIQGGTVVSRGSVN